MCVKCQVALWIRWYTHGTGLLVLQAHLDMELSLIQNMVCSFFSEASPALKSVPVL